MALAQQMYSKSHGTILAVEDDVLSLKILTAALTAEGYQVIPAVSGEEALKIAELSPPDLVLLDILMAGIDGFEVCRRLKANEQLRRIPVIFLSATSDKKERVTGFQLGAVDFVSKPFQREELLARVHTHLELTRMQTELKQQADELRNANALLHNEISIREAMASALAESEERFRTLASSAQDAFVMLDEQDRVIFWNEAASDMFGYTGLEITGKRFLEYLKPERFRKNFAEGFSQHIIKDTGSAMNKLVEMLLLKKDGTEFSVELSASQVTLREKQITIVVIRDITARVRAQEKLQRGEERLNLALDAAQMGIWDRNLITDVLWRSLRHDQIFGYDTLQENWNNEIMLSHFVPEDREKRAKELSADYAGDKFESEYRIIRASDRQERWVRFQGYIYRDKQGKPLRRMGIMLDVTERKLAELERHAMEAQNSLSQKLESVGRMAAGVAHEINTPMQFISDNTQFLKGSMTTLTDMLIAYRVAIETIASGKKSEEALLVVRAAEQENDLSYLLDEIPKTFSETMSGIQRVTQIIKSLKEFSHPNQSVKQPADLNKAIDTTVTVSRHEWKYVADLVTEFDPDLPMIPLFVDEINQVVLNLIVNASHAIGDVLKTRGVDKGVITIRTKQEGGNVQIDVEDNGSGIPESAQVHIFEPFFTTKGIGKGTGQGLAIIRTIVVKNHGGTISFTTVPGKGTTFHVRLPMTAPEEAIAVETV